MVYYVMVGASARPGRSHWGDGTGCTPWRRAAVRNAKPLPLPESARPDHTGRGTSFSGRTPWFGSPRSGSLSHLYDRRSIEAAARAAGLEVEIQFHCKPPGYLKFSRLASCSACSMKARWRGLSTTTRNHRSNRAQAWATCGKGLNRSARGRHPNLPPRTRVLFA
jgi:hypothetical protein